MNRYDSFEEEKFFSTELQNGKNPLEKNSKNLHEEYHESPANARLANAVFHSR